MVWTGLQTVRQVGRWNLKTLKNLKMEFQIILIIAFAFLMGCKGKHSKIKEPVNTFDTTIAQRLVSEDSGILENNIKGDSSFIKKLNENIFAYSVDHLDTLNSKLFHINYKQRKIDLILNTVSDSERKILEERINSLIFVRDSGAIEYFKKNKNNINKELINELSRIIPADYMLSIFYEYRPTSFKEVAQRILWYNGYSKPPRYEVEDPEADEIYLHNKEWVILYFPDILKYYNLNFPDQILLMCYLYVSGKPEYLRSFLNKRTLTDSEKEILSYNLNNFKIKNI